MSIPAALLCCLPCASFMVLFAGGSCEGPAMAAATMMEGEGSCLSTLMKILTSKIVQGDHLLSSLTHRKHLHLPRHLRHPSAYWPHSCRADQCLCYPLQGHDQRRFPWPVAACYKYFWVAAPSGVTYALVRWTQLSLALFGTVAGTLDRSMGH